MKNKVSPEVELQAMKMAKGTQKAKQTKEQTKLIAQGIEKGIAEYKKQQGKKSRELDKQRKKKTKQQEQGDTEAIEQTANNTTAQPLPWVLLALSWIGFVVYIALT